MKSSSSRSRAWRVLPSEEERPATRACDHPGCGQGGEFRAPRSRDSLNEYYWFCLEHVRAYNASWDYYAGMSPEEIESEVRRSTTWERPTWPLGTKGNGRKFSFRMDDPFGFFEHDDDEERAKPPRPPTPEELAMKTLELTPDAPLTLADLKARYKELVKRHHPDANNGDKGAEERFKRINQAYQTLKASLSA